MYSQFCAGCVYAWGQTDEPKSDLFCSDDGVTCFGYLTTEYRWPTAESKCAAEGAQLASLDTPEKLRFACTFQSVPMVVHVETK